MAAFDGLLLLVLTWGALALAAWAFIDALVRPAAGFVAATLVPVRVSIVTGTSIAIVFTLKPER